MHLYLCSVLRHDSAKVLPMQQIGPKCNSSGVLRQVNPRYLLYLVQYFCKCTKLQCFCRKVNQRYLLSSHPSSLFSSMLFNHRHRPPVYAIYIWKYKSDNYFNNKMKIKVKVVFMPTVDVFSIRCFQSKTMHCNGRSQNAVAKLIADILYIIYHTLYIIQHTD